MLYRYQHLAVDAGSVAQSRSEHRIKKFLEANRGTLQLVCPLLHSRHRVGRDGFDREVAHEALRLLRNPPPDDYGATALVLSGVPGVGKTFASLSFRYGAKSIGAPYEAVCAFIGFSKR